MLSLHRADAFALASGVVGFAGLASSSAYQPQLVTLAGSHAPQVAAILGLIGAAGSIASRVLSNPTTSATIASSPVGTVIEEAIAQSPLAPLAPTVTVGSKDSIMSQQFMKTILAMFVAELLGHPIRVGNYLVTVTPVAPLVAPA